MSLSTPAVCRAVAGAIATGVFSGAMLFGSGAIAAADPPPNCTAAELARVASGVSMATSDYLFSHPDVNAFFTGLKGQERDVLRTNAQNYLDANPLVQADLQGIRQPLVDFKAGCQAIPGADLPANCTAADLARVASGVSIATSDYLFSHPDVNAFFTGLKGQERDVLRTNAQNYLDANPLVQADLQGIRQPLVDFKAGCQ